MSVFRRKLKSGRKSKVYSYYFFVNGKRYAGSTGEVTKEKAREVEARERRKVRRGPAEAVEDVSFDAFSEEYLALHDAAKGKSAPFYQQTVKVLVRHFGPQMLSTIGPREIQEFRTARRLEVKKASTLNRSLSVLRHMLRKAVEWKRLEAMPVTSAFKREREEDKPEFFLTQGQWKALQGELPAWLRPFVLAALHTGARRGELVKLEWDDVDFDRGLIRFRNTKSGKDRKVRMSELLSAELRKLPNRLQGGRVFRGFYGEPIKGTSFRGAFQGAVRRAGLTGFRFHDLRHSAASFMVQAGIPLNTVREILGHQSFAMTLRYAHLAPEHQRDAIGVFDRLGTSPSAEESTPSATSK